MQVAEILRNERNEGCEEEEEEDRP